MKNYKLNVLPIEDVDLEGNLKHRQCFITPYTCICLHNRFGWERSVSSEVCELEIQNLNLSAGNSRALARESGVWSVGRAAISRHVSYGLSHLAEMRFLFTAMPFSGCGYVKLGRSVGRGRPVSCTQIYCASLS